MRIPSLNLLYGSHAAVAGLKIVSKVAGHEFLAFIPQCLPSPDGFTIVTPLQYIKGVPDPAARNGMRWTGVNYDLPAIRRGVNLVKEEDPIEVRVVDLKAMAGFSGAAGGRLEMEILREWGAFSIDRRILHLRMSRRNGGWVVEAEEPEITLFNRIYFVARRDEDNDPVGVERVVLKRGDVVARNINTSSLPALP